MNYIKHLTGFFEKVVADKTLNPTHISLYIALFQFWNCNRFKNPISISRDEIMRISKISSKATYHKCLRNLHDLNYINYQPSYNPFKGSHVIMFNFSEALKPSTRAERTPLNEPILNTSNELVVNKPVNNLQTSYEQAVVPYINNTNNTNSSNDKNVANLNEQAKKIEEINNTSIRIVSSSEVEMSKEEKSSAKKEEKELPENISLENIKSSSPAFADYNAEHTENSRQKKLREKKKEERDKSEQAVNNHVVKNHFVVAGLPQTENHVITNPKLEEVQNYFTQQNYPDIEAQKFYNYFSSIGWLVGGRSPMQNWNAAAENWMLNANKFSKEPEKPLPRVNQLNATTSKNYAEPL